MAHKCRVSPNFNNSYLPCKSGKKVFLDLGISRMFLKYCKDYKIFQTGSFMLKLRVYAIFKKTVACLTCACCGPIMSEYSDKLRSFQLQEISTLLQFTYLLDGFSFWPSFSFIFKSHQDLSLFNNINFWPS